ncbi:MAG: hypothetical protein DYH05_14595 [Acidobacteria bacterium ACB1]|nr:hypothetical protein [Acidobacteria bacterium ACB1]
MADLLKTIAVRAHSIKILRNDRMIVVRVLIPAQVLRTGVARIGSYRESDLRTHLAAVLCEA